MHGDLDNERLHIGYFENLEEDFIKIMTNLNVPQSEQMKSQFASIGHTNSSKHSHYSNYYSDELRQLVSAKDSTLIERYGYHFEAVLDDSNNVLPMTSNIHFSFKKLLGKKGNFLSLGAAVDVSSIRQKLAQCSEQQWAESGRHNMYEPHRDTQAIMLMHDNDFRHSKPTYLPWFDTFKSDLEPLFQRFPEFYKSQGYFVRVLFAKLSAGGTITPHIDRVPSLLNCHRVHLPITSNKDVWFSVGGESVNLPVGELIEINNATVHSVENNSDADRIHLIMDWVPY